jgi:multidrug resistance efflux pump
MKPPADRLFVDPATLPGVTGQVGRAYDDFVAAIAPLATSSLTADAVGNPDVASALSAFDMAWSAENTVITAAFEELVRAFAAATGVYVAADDHGARFIRKESF